jgi:hypothetical protein
MTSASTISKLLSNRGFPAWSFRVQQLKATSVVSVDPDLAATPEMVRMITELKSAGYGTQLNGSRFLIVFEREN